MGLRIAEARLRRDHTLPDGFVFYRYEWLKSGNEYKLMRLDGGVCPPLKSGPRKGKPNYKAATNEQSFFLTVEELAQIDADYERETGNCCQCEGGGQVAWRASVANGTEYKPCQKCGGSGKRKEND